MNRYIVFGLNIETELVLDELLPSNFTKPDITIVWGTLPISFGEILFDSHDLKIGKDIFFFNINNVAKYCVNKGNHMILEPYQNASYEDIKLYLLGSCMGAALYQRGILTLHGSCILMNGKGILITGEAGAGKSTIASVLYQKGGRMLTDDVAAIRYNERMQPMVYPSYPSRKLWADAMEHIDINEKKTSIIRSRKGLLKYSVESNIYFHDSPILLNIIIEIIPTVADKIQMQEVKGTRKLDIVMKNTYRKELPEVMELLEWHFRQCVNISGSVAVYQMIRPKNKHLEHEIVDYIMERLE